MGEEEKKVEEVKKEEAPKDEKPSDGGGGEEKKEEKKAEEESKEAKPEPPPPPPPEIVLRVFMHCEGCARKVRKSLKGFQGVEDVLTDCKTHKVVVKGEKADPLKVLERIQKKSHRQVELLSPIPKPPEPAAEEPKKPEEKEAVKPDEKKEEPQVITVVLKVHMHCEACAQEIKRRIQKMKGVDNAEPDLKNSQVTVKGVFEATKLVEYVSKRTGKRAVIVKVEPEKKAEEEAKPKEDQKEEKKTDEKEAKKVEGDNKEEKKEEAAAAAPAKEEAVVAAAPAKEEAVQNDVDPIVDVKKNEFYYYHHPQNHQLYNNPQRLAHEMFAYPPPPQIFSDENPNACSVM
ncbi:heavy metal-associated isoprenylated plant protein 7-like [Solanum pennellii]|uniref:Heavy metal-associated isoprenylated plant protein 7-like n=1 Tax=Solanum pennellii TaxID=28526 RepID=A0ABM1GY14_SOLPN|nr:heavy metal-associated isoprenylated plant protein 7-like [Solanum pennellii]